VRLDLLLLGLGVNSCEHRFELGALAVVQQHREQIERELRGVRQMLGLLSEQAELELAASLHHLQIERLVRVAFPLGGFESLLELFEGHAPFVPERVCLDKANRLLRSN
jgi:hypothetical protein